MLAEVRLLWVDDLVMDVPKDVVERRVYLVSVGHVGHEGLWEFFVAVSVEDVQGAIVADLHDRELHHLADAALAVGAVHLDDEHPVIRTEAALLQHQLLFEAPQDDLEHVRRPGLLVIFICGAGLEEAGFDLLPCLPHLVLAFPAPRVGEEDLLGCPTVDLVVCERDEVVVEDPEHFQREELAVGAAHVFVHETGLRHPQLQAEHLHDELLVEEHCVVADLVHEEPVGDREVVHAHGVVPLRPRRETHRPVYVGIFVRASWVGIVMTLRAGVGLEAELKPQNPNMSI